MPHDLFISHASEDKVDFVRPLVEKLRVLGVDVWYDEFELKLGDSLSRSIDTGLAHSSYGLVVLSQAFFAKDWPEYEYRGLLSREIGAGKVILPIWHGVSRDDVLQWSPPLADKMALKTEGTSLSQLAAEIVSVVRPDLFTRIQRKAAAFSTPMKRERIATASIKFGPPRHDALPEDLIGRIRLIRAALWDVFPHSMTNWLDGFRADSHPSREVRVWEHIGACFREYLMMNDLTESQLKQVFGVLVALSLDEGDQELAKQSTDLPADAVHVLTRMYDASQPPYDFVDDSFPVDYSASPDVLERIARLDGERFPFDVPDSAVRELLNESKPVPPVG